jgi:hypothetical protein
MSIFAAFFMTLLVKVSTRRPRLEIPCCASTELPCARAYESEPTARIVVARTILVRVCVVIIYV